MTFVDMSRSLLILNEPESIDADGDWWWFFDVRLLFVHCECCLFFVSILTTENWFGIKPYGHLVFRRLAFGSCFSYWLKVKIWPTIKFDVLFLFFLFFLNIHRLFSHITIMKLFEIRIEKKAKREKVVEECRGQNVNNGLINVFSSLIVEFGYDSASLRIYLYGQARFSFFLLFMYHRFRTKNFSTKKFSKIFSGQNFFRPNSVYVYVSFGCFHVFCALQYLDFDSFFFCL